jgi:hypothetical protein
MCRSIFRAISGPRVRWRLTVVAWLGVMLLGTPVSTPTFAAAPRNPTAVFRQLVVGRTSGTDATVKLRDAGYRVLVYRVCSNSVPATNVLRQVRVSATGLVVVDNPRPQNVAYPSPPASLQVLVTSGHPCPTT